jgi:transcriptional regulator with XRE-family HTH domain
VPTVRKPTANARIEPEPAAVLSKAVARAAERLGISRAQLARSLGVSASSVTRLYQGSYQLDPERKEWDLALLLVRAFRSLDSLVGDEATARQWLRSENTALNGSPIDLIAQAEGLVRVVQYLDAARGRV